MNLIDLSYLVATDIDGSLFLKAMEVIENAMVTVRWREDIDAFEEVKAEEKKENTNGGQYAYLISRACFIIW